MIKNSLIIIPFSVPWRWSTDYNNQTAKILSKNNFVICLFWIDPPSIKELIQKRTMPKLFFKIQKNIIGYNFIHLIPLKRFLLVRKINSYLNCIIVGTYALISYFLRGYKKKLIWVFDPFGYDIFSFFKRHYYSIYDCVDFFSLEDEKRLIQEVNLFTVNSRQLYKIHKKTRPNLHLVPQGFRLESFRKATFKNIPELKNKKPLIGYVGAINYRLDFNLIINIAKRNPEWYFAFWGPVQGLNPTLEKQIKELKSFPNAIIGKSDNKDEVPSVIKKFDICTIPYDKNLPFNKYCYPMKIFEYFYMGKPVISTGIEELKRFPKYVKIGTTVQEWERQIRVLLTKPWSKEYKQEQLKLAEDNSWEKKISSMMRIIESDQTVKTKNPHPIPAI